MELTEERAENNFQHIRKISDDMRKILEPGLPHKDGKPISDGSCLYASFVLQRALEQFADCVASVQGGDGKGDSGILGGDGHWRGHYWVEGRTFTGTSFIADITADQFGFEPVMVIPLKQGREIYRTGSPDDILRAVAHVTMEMAEIGKQSL